MEKKAYYAIFYPSESGGWGVRFPDAEAVHTCGDDLDEALFMAADALGGLLVLGRKGREYRDPRPYTEVMMEAGEGELVFPVVPSEQAMEEFKPKKRINVMVPVDLFDKIGKAVKSSAGLDRSKWICQAAEKYLAEKS